jgi:ABC-type multidrug transport system ATPase subunit
MLAIEGLTHVYPNGTRALDGVDLTIGKGMFGLLGPNGAGKSTLMRAVATLQTPTSGSIRFGDIDVIAAPEKLRRTLGYLPQDFGVYPRVSAVDLLDHLAVLKGIAGRGERRETVETLLQQVNLWEVRKKWVSGYSGGMRQRFGIAQALIGRPELIIVDDVADLCPRMAVLSGGRILTEGAPAALIEALDGRVWRKVIDRGDLEAERAHNQVISTRLAGGRTVIHVLADSAPGPGFAPVAGGLEDVYFSTLAASRRAA